MDYSAKLADRLIMQEEKFGNEHYVTPEKFRFTFEEIYEKIYGKRVINDTNS